ncbi:MAG: FAD-binding oxidoreductase [Gammaproteobacteria bacterium]|nr:FAD-binding oxidoreductase [Gammaproteobacteria bacterium]MXW19921.1 FAD-binding oxidoreductase [Gammaproteobacteria bacterium]MXW46861.1 FAD-binding oxidoreductase [Gammaproteobacteria bacterium]MXZ26890.1 FAD-binding oxidoreductase [Gammaproteobacteria bacterium]MYD02207.1 FAD-binding oxidoreductase [Gammaproteobacteria bacterium]
MRTPDGVSESDFRKALEEFANIVGSQWVFTSPEAVDLYRDVYSIYRNEPEEPVIPAAIAPYTAEEVQAVVKVANRYRIPLYPISTGKNLGYGGPSPVYSGSLVLDLKRMDRILNVDVQSATVLVEPGVSFYQLYEYFEENNIPLTMDIPDPAWGSLVGHALDRGLAHTYSQYGRDRWSSRCGMEVVLPTGELIRTGTGAAENTAIWQDHQYGMGPQIDGIFAQSNYGVVTKMGFWLRPAHEGFRRGRVHFANFDDIHKMLELDTRLQNMEVYNGMANLGTPLYGSMMPGMHEKPVTDPEHLRLLEIKDSKRPDPGPLARYGKENRIPFWVLDLKYHGPNSITKAQWEYTRDLFSREVPGCWFTEYEPLTFPLDKATMDTLNEPGRVEKVHLGIPTLARFASVMRSELNPNPDVGHLWFAPMVPKNGTEVLKAQEVLQRETDRLGVKLPFPYYAQMPLFWYPRVGIFLAGWQVSPDPKVNQRTREQYIELTQICADLGWTEYRAPAPLHKDIIGMANGFNDSAMMKFRNTLKDAIDPNGIISAGRYDVWPKHLREERES